MTPNIMGDWTPDEKRDHALNQIQAIAYNGELMADCRLPLDRIPADELSEYVKALEAKLQRIVNIAEAQEPDEDWRPAMIDEAS